MLCTTCELLRVGLRRAQGCYRVRGDVIDIFPAESEREAIRLELFDDEVDRISYFDPLTGVVSRSVPRATIYPKTHYVTPREVLLKAVDDIEIELGHRLKEFRAQNKLVEAGKHSISFNSLYRYKSKNWVDNDINSNYIEN